MNQNLANFYGNQSENNKLLLKVGGVIALALLIYWFVVRYTGKNMTKGKSFNDANGSPFNNGTTVNTGPSNNQSLLLANELAIALDYTWGFGSVCGDPDNICEKLQRVNNGDDNLKKAVGQAYQNANGKLLSEAVKANPCCCTKSSWTCRDTKFPLDKTKLIQKLQNLGI